MVFSCVSIDRRVSSNHQRFIRSLYHLSCTLKQSACRDILLCKLFSNRLVLSMICQFLSFCISVLGKGDREKVVDLLAERADHLPPPVSIRSLCFCCCNEHEFENDHAKARAVLLQCQTFAMQFVFWRPVTTIATVMLEKYEYYGPWGAEGPNDWRAPQFYIFLIQNLSIFMAFTGLLKFYHLVDKELAW
jgi:hypothetical protein